MRLVLAAALLAAAIPALARAGDIEVKGAELRASIGHSPNSAAYMTLVNRGDKPDRLVSAACACAGMVMVHRTEVSGGMAMMMDSPAVAIPAHGEAAFRPGGLHLMLMGLKKPLVDGSEQEITLTFARAGQVRAKFKVKAQVDAAPPPAHPTPMGAMPGM